QSRVGDEAKLRGFSVQPSVELRGKARMLGESACSICHAVVPLPPVESQTSFATPGLVDFEEGLQRPCGPTYFDDSILVEKIDTERSIDESNVRALFGVPGDEVPVLEEGKIRAKTADRERELAIDNHIGHEGGRR